MKSIMRLYRIYRLIVLAVGVVTALSAATAAKNFISFKGQYHLTYPDSWEQVDYNSVDYFLSKNSTSGSLFNYEAVFAPHSDRPFYEEPYLMLTFDSIGTLSGRTRDSAIGTIVAGFTSKLDTVKRDGIVSVLKADAPFYIPEDSMLAIQTDIHEGRTIVRRNLLCVRFTSHGLANFYFYATDSQWMSNLPTFVQIAQSLTPGTSPQGAEKESVKIADLNRQSPTPDSGVGVKKYWPIPTGIVVVLIIAMAARRKKSQKSAGSTNS